jgi:hypothetical protein
MWRQYLIRRAMADSGRRDYGPRQLADYLGASYGRFDDS